MGLRPFTATLNANVSASLDEHAELFLGGPGLDVRAAGARRLAHPARDRDLGRRLLLGIVLRRRDVGQALLSPGRADEEECAGEQEGCGPECLLLRWQACGQPWRTRAPMLIQKGQHSRRPTMKGVVTGPGEQMECAVRKRFGQLDPPVSRQHVVLGALHDMDRPAHVRRVETPRRAHHHVIRDDAAGALAHGLEEEIRRIRQGPGRHERAIRR